MDNHYINTPVVGCAHVKRFIYSKGGWWGEGVGTSGGAVAHHLRAAEDALSVLGLSLELSLPP